MVDLTLSGIESTDNHPGLDALALSQPALNANNVICHAMQNGLRITFLEGTPSVQPGLVRGSVFLPYEVALGLKELIEQSLKVGNKAAN